LKIEFTASVWIGCTANTAAASHAAGHAERAPSAPPNAGGRCSTERSRPSTSSVAATCRTMFVAWKPAGLFP
jgi:hypothetical protein